LESYLKSRSGTLDQEIASVKARLEKTAPGLIGNSPLLMKGQSLNPTINSGTGNEKKIELPSELRSDERIKSKEFIASPTRNTQSISQGNDSNAQSSVSDFIKKMKLRMSDLSINAAALKEILLPKDLMLPGETSLPIHELTTIFQTDLAMPVSTSEQVLLLKEFGAENGYVNVKKLFKDANIWNEDIDPYASVTRTSSQAEGARRRIHQQEEAAHDREKSLMTSTDSELYADLITRSAKEIDALSNMHKILQAENELDNSFQSVESPSPKPNPNPSPYPNNSSSSSSSSSNVDRASNSLERGRVMETESDDVLMQSLRKSNYSPENERDALAARLEARAAAVKDAERAEASMRREQIALKTNEASSLRPSEPMIKSTENNSQPKYDEKKTDRGSDENKAALINTIPPTDDNYDRVVANRLSLLEQENARLKAEMSVFDRNVFVEVED